MGEEALLQEAGIGRALLDRAYLSSDGELAWTREDAITVARALGRAGVAISGGEVWLAEGQGRWFDVIPMEDGTIGIHGWASDPCRRPDESWETCCQRLAEFAVAMLEQMSVEGEAVSSVRPRIRYHLSVHERGEQAVPERLD